MEEGTVRAILFDVFGTVVDWRSSLINQFNNLHELRSISLSSEAIVDEWRVQSRALLDLVRDSKQPWLELDGIHRQSLKQILVAHGLELEDSQVESVNKFWHRLEPWADVAKGLGQLKPHFILAAFTNGNLSLMIDVARHASLPWDAIFSADVFKRYKPETEIYLGASELLRLDPEQILLCAAHNYDLKKARALGFKTAFVPRTTEFGPEQQSDFRAEERWDFIAEDFEDLARQLIT
jgi:2-haloacid dehalogenase